MSEPVWIELWCAARDLPASGLTDSEAVALSAQLADVWRAARAAWPEVELEPDRFIAHLAMHAPEGVAGAAYLARAATSDLYLACACAAGNTNAIAAFEDHCLCAIDGALTPLRSSADMIAEVKQQIRCRLLVANRGVPRIQDFQGRGSLRAWVRVIAVREALRATRRSRHDVELEEAERLQAFVTDERDAISRTGAHHQQAFAQAFAGALRALPARDRTMLRQHVIDGMTVGQLGAMYRVHRATAARMLERARRSVRAATRARLRAELEMSSTELSSVLRGVLAHLEITLRWFGRRRAG